jgi:hypothetical protein
MQLLKLSASATSISDNDMYYALLNISEYAVKIAEL